MAHYNLAQIRKTCNITQRELANRLGSSINKIQYSESGQGSMSYSSLLKLVIGAKMTDFDDEPIINWDGEALYEARKKSHLSQKELAAIVGCNFRDISRWETGRNEPRPDMVESLAKACGKTVSYFYKGSVSHGQISNILTLATSYVLKEKINIEIYQNKRLTIDYMLTIPKVVSYAA